MKRQDAVPPSLAGAGTRGRLVVDVRLAVPPSANRWTRKYRGRMVTARAVRDYQHAVYIRLFAAGLHKPLVKDRPVRVDLWWFRGPLETPTKGKYYAGDLDNREGILLDALQGTAYTNDSQVVEKHVYRRDVAGEGYVVLHVYDLA